MPGTSTSPWRETRRGPAVSPAIVATATRADAPDALLDDHILLRTLHGGLRAELWLGLAAGAAMLHDTPRDLVVVVKHFFPHLPGPALDGLLQELELARRLEHENIARHWFIATGRERPFLISEYLEGVTLRTLLLRASQAGTPLAQASVARILSAIIAAVLHAESRAASVAEGNLVQQLVAADDVFITFDGSVKLLGFKNRLRGTEGSEPGANAAPSVTSSAAIDALLTGHFSAGLAAVLGAANDTGVRRFDRLRQVERALQRWQTAELGSDGRAELAASMERLLSAARRERAAQLAASLEQTAFSGDPAVEDTPPVSEVRAVQSRRQATLRLDPPRAAASDE